MRSCCTPAPISPKSSAAGCRPIPRGQHDAADALGLSYWKKNGLIILPQAIRHVIPPLVNTFIAFFKDTSLVLIIGIFDLLTTAKTSIIDPAWQPFSIEVYVFVGLIYFVFCFAMSRYSRRSGGAGTAGLTADRSRNGAASRSTGSAIHRRRRLTPP